MNNKASNVRRVVFSLCVFGYLMPNITLGSTPPGLTKYVPSDVFLCIYGKTNPERQFIEDYWQEVCDAFEATGITNDLMALVSGFLSDGQSAEVERLKEKITQLIDDVDWHAMAGKEVLFAERLPKPNISGSSINMGPPDLVWMFRGDASSAKKNFQGLSAIFRTAADEINSAVGNTVVAVIEPEGFGDHIVTLAPASMPLDQAPASLSLALRNDMIIMTLGTDILKETLDFMQGRNAAKSLANCPRYKMALQGLPEAEDSVTFFDMQTMLKPIQQLVTAGMASMGGSSASQGSTNQAAAALNRQALKAYGEKDYKKALSLIKKANEADPDSGLVMYNLACFSAITGNNEDALTWLTKAVDGGFHDPQQIARDDDLKALRGDARFKTALAKAKKAAEGHGTSDKSAQIAIVNRIFETIGIMDYSATVEYTEGRTTHSSCKLALVKDAASNPFYPVIASHKPLKQYSRYLPKETESFSVSSSMSFVALYHFVLDTIKMVGPEGIGILQQWDQVQQQHGFNVERDLLALFEGEFISVTMASDLGLASVTMVKVTDEEVAREKLTMGLKHLSEAMQQMAAQQPMMAMFALRTAESTDERLPDFLAISIGSTTMQLGVVDGYLMLGTSADAIALCRDTAMGKHPNITKNQRIMNTASIPQGSFTSISFTDKRGLGNELAGLMSGISMGGSMAMMMIPDPQQQKILVKVLGMIAKMAPVVKKIDFYESSSSSTTFNGLVWMTKEVTNYREKEHRASAN